jgi:hypothetical protein
MKRFLSFMFVSLLCATAVADKDKDRADVLFKQGRKLMGDKRYAEACPALEESFKLDPGIGTQMNIAKCYAEWGKLARAYHAYVKAEDIAKQENDPRASRIHEFVVETDKEVPRLTIRLPAGASPSGLSVTIDGVAIDASELGKPQLVDPGPHNVEYSSDGGAKKSKVVPVERGADLTVTLDGTQGADTDHPRDHEAGSHHRTPSPSDPGRNQKLIAYGTAGVGGALILISSYMALSARSKYNDALSAHCMNMKDMCDQQGLTATHDARHEANVATVLFLLGGAAVGGGVALYLLAPHAATSDEHALRIAPELRRDGGGIVLGGRF